MTEAVARRHDMPFGASLTGAGALFRLWAPDAPRVELVLEESPEPRPMTRLSGGWFERTEPDAGPGCDYGYRIDGARVVPDPASRFNPGDAHGLSRVVDPETFPWRDGAWRGRSWAEAVIYELHVGTFTPAGTFRAVIEKLDYLVDLGITAIELMPVADFPGGRNWGYDGVLLFAPDGVYGTPEDLKALIQAAHERDLMVFMDVVYNHFGPDGNYLPIYAGSFFDSAHQTPWGAGINFDGEGCRAVRDFFIHNALYWLEEFHCDGLRLDAVHALTDDSQPSFLEELAGRVRQGPGRDRNIHLILENDANAARYLRRNADGNPLAYDAQWNDDLHHTLHHLLTGETDGYYADYVEAPESRLGRILQEGFAYQGEPSVYRGGHPRGEVSRELPPAAFVSFLQTHDQVGNRAYGERLCALVPERPLRAAVTLLLLAPFPPLLFMGEEFGCPAPFLYFCDFEEPLATAVRQGRRGEFARFAPFAAEEARAGIPDPCDPATFAASKLRWDCLAEPPHRDWLAFYRHLLAVRRRLIVPRLTESPAAEIGNPVGDCGLAVCWPLRDWGELTVMTNLGGAAVRVRPPRTDPIAVSSEDVIDALAQGSLLPWSTAWWLDEKESGRF